MNIKDTVLWLGDAASYRACLQAEELSLQPGAIEARSNQYHSQEESEFGDYDYMVSRHGNVAVVDVKGSLSSSESGWHRYFGGSSYPAIRNAVAEAVNNPAVKTILLDVDSTGGAAKGAGELSKFLADVDANFKPVHAFTGGTMASAAYWLSSAARSIGATEMASVGSIGVIAVHQEVTAMLEKEGIKATVFREGKFKALGGPYEKLTQKATDYIQNQLSTMYGFFVGAVAENRGLSEAHVRANAAEGQEFWAAQAKDVGLIDSITTFDALVNQLDAEHNSTQHEVPSPLRGQAAMAKSKRVVITTAAAAAIAAGVPAAEALATAAAEALATAAAEAALAAEAETQAALAAEAEDAGEAEDEGGAEDEGAADAPVPAAAQDGAVRVLTAQIKDLQTQMIDAQVLIRTLTGERDTAQAAQAGLMNIATSSVQRMQIAMGGSAQNMTHLDAAALIAQHASTEKAFSERYPVGGKAVVETEKESGDGAATPQKQAAARATSFNKVV